MPLRAQDAAVAAAEGVLPTLKQAVARLEAREAHA
jgi:hypothetical protein